LRLMLKGGKAENGCADQAGPLEESAQLG